MVMKGRWIAIVSFVVLILSSSGFAQAGLSSGRGVPMPSLSLDLDEERSCALSFVVHITNTGDEEKDDAANVQITVPVIKGASFVDHLEYNPLVGDLQEGQVADVPITIVASPAFYDASLGTEIKVNITVINEDNRADHNTGKHIVYTALRCQGQQSPGPETSPEPEPTPSSPPEPSPLQQPLVSSGICNPGENRPCGCDCATAKVLMVLDDYHHGEDLEDYEANYQNLIDLGVDVTRINEPADGIGPEHVAGYDLVWFANPGWPIDDQKTLDTLIAYFNAGNPVVFQGDDLTWGQGTIQKATLESFTGLKNINNGLDADYNVNFADTAHPLLWQLRGKSFTYREDDIDTNKILALDVVELAHGTLKSNAAYNGSAIIIRDQTAQGKGLFLLTLLTLSKIEPQSTALTFTGNIVNYLLNKAGKCTCGIDTGACEFSTQNCLEDGTWGACEGVPPVSEICDGQDNDCDGALDEDLTCECIGSESRSCGTDEGVCDSGIQRCDNGHWGACEGAIEASPPETCNALDDDCDGFTDESIDDIIEGIDTGACVPQISSCVGGVMQVTQQRIDAAAETCNALDDDCDGLADEDDSCHVAAPDMYIGFEPLSGCEQNGTVTLSNQATHPDDMARQVTLSLEVIEGASFVERVEYNPLAGDISAGQSLAVPYWVVPSASYAQAPAGTRISLRVSITREDADPSNVGKTSEVTISSCGPACVPAPETCNRADDDCDGLLDEDIRVDCGVSDVGTCSWGYRLCDNGALGRCIGEVVPDVETCNGLDDDCDGEVDESISRSCGTDEGSCVSGTETCSNGIWGQCDGTAIGPHVETCNGVDDNCDGLIDDGLNCECIDGASRSCGTDEGQCSAGTQTCAGGQWGSCSGGLGPALETCDSADNDCDGLIDEELIRSCGDTEQGECSFGLETCNLGLWGSCQGAVVGSAESCNLLDDDCDGKTDESLSERCGVSDVGECRFGQRACEQGGFGSCVGAIDPSTEVCDGLDNDCDGSVDEDIADEALGSTIGACAPQVRSCIGGTMTLIDPGVGPSAETCNGLDDDCNGVVDESLPDLSEGSDVGSCTQTLRSCQNGAYQVAQQGILPAPETCDSLDNDCDGLVDEDITDERLGNDVGLCQSEVRSCVNGQMSVTQTLIDESPETCDGQDNDCDGSIDDELLALSTGTDEGSCQRSVQECVGGAWIETQPGISPATESCNGADDDCDGLVDDSIVDVLFGNPVGECVEGLRSCANGAMTVIDEDVGPSAEVCDGLDNDCDGTADNGISCECLSGQTRSCGTDVGSCQAGVQSCIDGTWGECGGEINSATETCDGLDNDCDGSVDEAIDDLVEGESRGTCLAKISSCVNGAMTVVQQAVTSSVETCDGLDNDCDGTADDGISDIVNGSDEGACQSGIERCVHGAFTLIQSSVEPSSDICDGLDNDCDGTVDEDIADDVIGSDVGACRTTVRSCVSGQMSIIAIGINGSDEICDGIDNDCDGETDEGIADEITGTDIGICQSRIKSCVGGLMQTIQSPIGPSVESCNGADDDCDGSIDNDLAPLVSGTDEGSCQAEKRECIGGSLVITQALIGPSTETCDGVDNDCDGSLDEDLTKTCGTDEGACAFGTQTCSLGNWGSCEGSIDPLTETCDGADNDCDGTIDESLVQTCGSAIGECRQGSSVCTMGTFGACVGSTVPALETCNGLDDDCNGLADDGISCECTNGHTRSCGTDEGVCESGTQTCSDGTWGSCDGSIGSSDETCDAIDNDCDGSVDEDLTEVFGSDVGACELGQRTCVGGHYVVTTQEISSSLELCDGIDNDCDGSPDEDLYQSCGSTDVGACSLGIQSCVAGSWGSCAGNIEPAAETCDGIDTDCDGSVDNDVADILTGIAVGVCQPTRQTCSNGVYTISNVGVGSHSESCNGLDDDCDGVVDNDVATEISGTEEGICTQGVRQCSNGDMVAVQTEVGPRTETCNGLDDDCDGSIDDGLICDCRDGDVRNCGTDEGSCVAGTQTCSDGRWGSCNGLVEGTDEICNGLDDDCDNLVDDGLADVVAGTEEGSCQSQINSCINGAMTLIQEQVGPSTEACDGSDNDCDGLVDEDIPFAYDGLDKGQCVSAAYGCISGEMRLVRNALGPSSEVCDGLDNDCDGFTDEDQVDTITGSSVGACAPTITSCVGGSVVTLQTAIVPIAETCDGIDNDCDGLIDEEILPISSGIDTGECLSESKSCLGGTWTVTQVPVLADFETCNGLDDNCDGTADNGIDCSCISGQTRSCGSAVGSCTTGTQNCLNGQWGDCLGATQGGIESCDGIDNDCDGQVDENLLSGFVGASVGRCQPETRSCVNGTMVVSQEQTFPSTETCNMIDDDCDGLVDEELAYTKNTTDVGACQAEKWECLLGQMAIAQVEVLPTLEDCNGIDDNCDGQIDEECPGPQFNYSGPALNDTQSNITTPSPEPAPSDQDGSSGSAPSSSGPRISSRRDDSPSLFHGPLISPVVSLPSSPTFTSPSISTISPAPITPAARRESEDMRIGIKLISGPAPLSVSPADPIVKIPAIVKNVGNLPLSDITAAAFSSDKNWISAKLPIDTLAPGQEMPISFDISPLYCSPRLGEGDYHLSLGNLTFTLRVEESIAVNDEETITVPLRVDPLTVMTAPQDYARNQTMKVCYFVGNLDDKTREKLEIEFEMHDRTDDVIIDYISPVSVNAQEMLLKVKDYGLRNVPDPKTYHLRGFLYENGTLFSPTYLTGEDTSQVDLSQLPPFEGIWASFMRRSREVIS